MNPPPLEPVAVGDEVPAAYARPAGSPPILALCALLVAISSAGAWFLTRDPAPGPDLPHVARRIQDGGGLRIVAFGSSSTQGVGASRPDAAYPARLESVLRLALPSLRDGIKVINSGIGGEDVDDMALRIDRDVIGAKPDLVIWQTGSNDPMRQVPLDRFERLTRAGILRMRAAGIDVMLMEPQWCPRLDKEASAAGFRDAVRAIGAELDVPVIRRSDMMREWIADRILTAKDLFAPDGLHMRDAGYALLARAAAADILHQSDALDGRDGETAALAIQQ